MSKKKDEARAANSPFGALKGLRDKLVEDAAKEKAAAAEKARAKAAGATQAARAARAVRDEDLFRAAMAGVKPLPESERGRVRTTRSPSGATPPSEDDEVLDALQGMVDGRVPLDFTDSDEYVEGKAADCSRLELSKLRRGELAVEAEIDLHGHNRDEARAEVEAFLDECLRRGQRCVNIVCGRGLHSEGGKAVLKDLLVRWLARGRLSQNILAFSSAKRHHGGVGAITVLLRRRKLR